jgi:two-component system response regulator AtoC
MSADTKLEVLVVDDDRPSCEVLGSMLGSDSYHVTLATSGTEALNLIRDKHFPIVVSDLNLGEPDGMELLTQIKKDPRPSALIFITGYGSMDTAVKAIHEGAFDYLSKPLNLLDVEPELKSLVNRAAKHLETLNEPKDGSVPQFLNPSMKMIGKSKQIVQIYRTIAKAAMSESNVLIIGESGTGKELVARAIHDNSGRANKPFITVNCCALSEGLLESELFGHMKGSFTGAIGNKRGLFEEANDGTLFLDEIGDISPALQVKLLRVLQEGEIKPVGSSESRRVNVRIVAATHRDLDSYVADGKFREDLYYRLKVILVETPPLRERLDDLPELVNFFLARSNRKSGTEVTGVSAETMALLQAYHWPGNIRELENSIERAVAMTNTSIIYPEDLPYEILRHIGVAPTDEAAPAVATSVRPIASVRPEGTPSLEELEKEHILRTLEEVKYNKSRAASILGIDRVTLYRKASRYGIEIRGR